MGGGGSGRAGVSAQILYVCALFWFLTGTLVQKTSEISGLRWKFATAIAKITCFRCTQHRTPSIGTGERGVITKGGFSLEESLESLNSLESLENGWILICFPQSGGSLETQESLNS